MTSVSGSLSSRKRPFVLLDRCVPDGVGKALEHFEIPFTTLAKEYGRDEAQRLTDVEWIRDSAANGWIALTQNFKIPRVAHEAAAIRDCGARILCYHRANLTKEAKSLILGRHMRAIQKAHLHEGPAFWRIAPKQITYDI